MKQITKLISFAFMLALATGCYAQQKASIDAVLKNNTENTASKLVFDLTITNKEYTSVYVHNTDFIKEYLSYPSKTYIWPDVYKKTNGKYERIDAVPLSGIPVPDSCDLQCCNCTILKKGESVKMSLNLLKCCPLSPGEYKIIVSFQTPWLKGAKNFFEINSKPLYFTIKKP